MTSKFNQMVKAYANGIKVPYAAMRASDVSGLPFYALCAALEKESNGGENVFGHDPTIYSGAGKVTKAKYLAYKKARDKDLPLRRHMQGVGPLQLTWWEYQDRADRLGGCWIASNNLIVGAEILAAYWDKGKNSWEYVGTRYNGSAIYGKDFAKKVEKWKGLLT